ncbi:hypothetical protein ACLMJK_006427 [Lecanora helva]
MGGETLANHKQYQLEHINDNKTPTICAVYALGYALAVAAVGLRFLSRKVSNMPYLADDWVILAALIIFTALFGVDIWHVVGGQLGKHAIRVTPHEIMIFLKSLYVFNPLYTNIIPLVKISILLLYKRLFPLDRVHLIIYILVGILVGFEISTTFVDIFGCHPIAAAWNKKIPHSHCVVPQTLYMATAGINLATDVIILCIPMPLVWGLRLSVKRKVGVSLIFVLGSLVCVTTIFRIATFHYINGYDITWSYINTAYWTYSELVLSFICACVPTFRPVLKALSANIQTSMRKFSLPSSYGSYGRSSSKQLAETPVTFNSKGLAKQNSKEAKGLASVELEKIDEPLVYEVNAFSRNNRQQDEEMGVPKEGIQVVRDVTQS